MKKLGSFVTGIYILLGFNFILAGNISVRLSGGYSEAERDTMASVLEEVLQNSRDYLNGSTEEFVGGNYFEPDAYLSYIQILHKKCFYPEADEYVTILMKTKTGSYLVSGLSMKLTNPENKAVILHKHLTFVFNEKYKISGWYFTPEKHHYQDVLQYGIKVMNSEIINELTEVVKEYVKAYNNKDLILLDSLFATNMLVITGYVPEKLKGEPTPYIEYRKQNKEEYLQKLRKIFTGITYLKVDIDNILVEAHPFAGKIYGIQGRQIWQSDHYEDEGYIFLMVDLFNPDKPHIHVRIWQPKPFK